MNNSPNKSLYNHNKLYKNIRNYNNIESEDKDRISRLLNIEANDISIKFFSDENINNLNNQIITEIMRKSEEELGQKMRIKPQQKEKMITVMRYIYYTNIKNTYEVDVEVQRLNDKFMELCIPTIFQALVAHIRYIENYNRTRNIPLDIPQSTKQKADLKPFSSLFGF